MGFGLWVRHRLIQDVVCVLTNQVKSSYPAFVFCVFHSPLLCSVEDNKIPRGKKTLNMIDLCCNLTSDIIGNNHTRHAGHHYGWQLQTCLRLPLICPRPTPLPVLSVLHQGTRSQLITVSRRCLPQQNGRWLTASFLQQLANYVVTKSTYPKNSEISLSLTQIAGDATSWLQLLPLTRPMSSDTDTQ